MGQACAADSTAASVPSAKSVPCAGHSQQAPARKTDSQYSRWRTAQTSFSAIATDQPAAARSVSPARTRCCAQAGVSLARAQSGTGPAPGLHLVRAGETDREIGRAHV